MLKKAGIVVLGATAGVMSLSGMAFAGTSTTDESGSHDKDSSQHEGHDGGRDDEGGSCDKIAYSSGDRLVSLDNLASNLDISRVNVLAKDESLNAGQECDGDKIAASEGDRLLSADNALSNADISRLNVLASDESANIS